MVYQGPPDHPPRRAGASSRGRRASPPRGAADGELPNAARTGPEAGGRASVCRVVTAPMAPGTPSASGESSDAPSRTADHGGPSGSDRAESRPAPFEISSGASVRRLWRAAVGTLRGRGKGAGGTAVIVLFSRRLGKTNGRACAACRPSSGLLSKPCGSPSAVLEH